MALGAILKGIIGPILGPLVDKIPDINLRRKLEADAEQALLAAMTGVVMAQVEVNKIEAQHKSIFVAGWRPAVGWVCAIALAYNFILRPIAMYGAFLAGVDLTDAPELNITELMAILAGMLGLATNRTYEKTKGVASSVWNGAKKK
jgi:hypothetical protein